MSKKIEKNVWKYPLSSRECVRTYSQIYMRAKFKSLLLQWITLSFNTFRDSHHMGLEAVIRKKITYDWKTNQLIMKTFSWSQDNG